jgi:E3 ubiquitin-protein ligase TRIP12
LVSPGLLQAILALLLPGTTNLIGPHIHTMFLQVIAYTAKASPRLSAELLKMNVVDTLYQILTGVSPPSGTEDVAAKIDSVVIMQALIHRPKDQVFETLNVICELLPDVTNDGLSYLEDLFDAGYPGRNHLPLSSETKQTSNQKRVELFEGCKAEVKRFAVILLPTLTDAYSSTVNLNVRQKVLTAQLKMLSNLDTDILEEALRAVPYASFLASIFSQQDHPTLVTYALQAAELLLKRLESIYRYQFYREGVVAEISVLASRPIKPLEARSKDLKSTIDVEVLPDSSAHTASADQSAELEVVDNMDTELHLENNDDEDDDDGDDDHHDNGDDDDHSDSSSSSDQSPPSLPNIDDIITLRAKKFIEIHEKETDKPIRDKASAVLDDLKSLAGELRKCSSLNNSEKYSELFVRLAKYFEGDALESITSYELKSSKIVDVLLDIFSVDTPTTATDPRSLFLEAFMGASNNNKVKTASSASPATPFSVLVSKLQDLLSRSEHFEVITVHQNSYDGRGSAANMLAKQLRLKLVAEEDSGIPKSYRNIMVSIHAIATFKALDDYLRPRMHVAAERPRGNRTREQFAAYAQALAEGRAPPPPETPSSSASRPSKRASKPKPKASEDAEAGPSSASREKTRRSSRRQQSPPPPPPAPKARSGSSQDPLECADEERLSDQDSLDENAALNAIVDELEEELGSGLDDGLDDDEPDPSAVSVEVASTGKATARKEDGTRIATPVPGTPSAKPSDRLSTPASRLTALLQDSALRQSLSYAAAVQSTPQDWHIEFSVNDQPISSDTSDA